MTKRMIDADALLNWVCLQVDYLPNINPEDMCCDSDLMVFKQIIKKINELATPVLEPQENIFDAEGWCWDMDKAPVTAIGCLIKFFDILVLKKYHVGTQNECKQYERIADVWLDYELKLKDKDQQKLNIADVSIFAWRPLPNTPKEA